MHSENSAHDDAFFLPLEVEASECEPMGGATTPHALYSLNGIREALSLNFEEEQSFDHMPFDEVVRHDNEHQSRLSAILAKGKKGC